MTVYPRQRHGVRRGRGDRKDDDECVRMRIPETYETRDVSGDGDLFTPWVETVPTLRLSGVKRNSRTQTW